MIQECLLTLDGEHCQFAYLTDILCQMKFTELYGGLFLLKPSSKFVVSLILSLINASLSLYLFSQLNPFYQLPIFL